MPFYFDEGCHGHAACHWDLRLYKGQLAYITFAYGGGSAPVQHVKNSVFP